MRQDTPPRAHSSPNVQATYNEEDEFVDPSGKYKLVKKGAYAAVECTVTPGELVKAEGGAMVTMSSNVHLDAKLEGSIGAALFRSCCAGEGMFMSHFSLREVRFGGRAASAFRRLARNTANKMRLASRAACILRALHGCTC
jgi:Mitochondrial biogenesis AIM24